MAATGVWKVYHGKEFVASMKYATLAGVLASALGTECTIRYGHSKIVWREGSEEVSAGESYDICAATCESRMRDHLEKQRQWRVQR